ncbi:MAG: hypothetical protein J6Q22_10995 [Prevotella sp.]|nr:hypothetical protein [Prevotella sp.]
MKKGEEFMVAIEHDTTFKKMFEELELDPEYQKELQRIEQAEKRIAAYRREARGDLCHED